jgi:uncharacterized cupredoxin-like copper-binding protein
MTRSTISQLVSQGARSSRRLAISLLVASAAALVLLAGGPAAHPSTAGASSAMVQIHAGDFSFALDHTAVTPGPVHIAFFNDSATFPHEVFIYPKDQPKLADLLARMRAGEDVDETAVLSNVAGHVEDVDPGKSIAFDLNLPAGDYEFACFIKSDIAGQRTVHYDLGMHSIVTSTTAPDAPAAAPAAVPAAPAQPAGAALAGVKAPNTGTGPEQNSTPIALAMALAAAGLMAMAAGLTRGRAR